VLERGVVGGWDMPDVVGGEPECEGEGGAGDEPHDANAADSGGKRRRETEDEQCRRPLGEDDVLEEVRAEEVVGERIERGDGGGEQEEAAGGEDS
jgi:hypothetical protein